MRANKLETALFRDRCLTKPDMFFSRVICVFVFVSIQKPEKFIEPVDEAEV